MSDNPSDGDAERLESIRRYWPKTESGDFIADTYEIFLIRLLDARDAALREAKAEIGRLRTVAEAARKAYAVERSIGITDWPLCEALAALDAAPVQAIHPDDGEKEMMSKPIAARPDLDALLSKAAERFKALSPEEQAAMLRAQCISWVYGNLALAGSSVTKDDVAKAADKKYGGTADTERAAIVAWLRAKATNTILSDCGAAFSFAADMIERGEHRRPAPDTEGE